MRGALHHSTRPIGRVGPWRAFRRAGSPFGIGKAPATNHRAVGMAWRSYLLPWTAGRPRSPEKWIRAPKVGLTHMGTLNSPQTYLCSLCFFILAYQLCRKNPLFCSKPTFQGEPPSRVPIRRCIALPHQAPTERRDLISIDSPPPPWGELPKGLTTVGGESVQTSTM